MRFKQVRRIAVEASMNSKHVVEEPLGARKELPSFGGAFCELNSSLEGLENVILAIMSGFHEAIFNT